MRARPERTFQVALAVLLPVALPCVAAADGIGNENAPPQEICGTCHGLNGVSRMAKFPKLAGQRADYLEKQIRDFREGRRSNDGGQMAAVVTEISDEQVAEIARYFAGQAAPEPEVVTHHISSGGRAAALFQVGDPQAGVEPCGDCHAREGRRAAAHAAPLLSAQHEAYIAKQLGDFRSGARGNDAGQGMQHIARRLTDGDIAALARFLAAMPREGKHQ